LSICAEEVAAAADLTKDARRGKRGTQGDRLKTRKKRMSKGVDLFFDVRRTKKGGAARSKNFSNRKVVQTEKRKMNAQLCPEK
jgi:hypothetical protein